MDRLIHGEFAESHAAHGTWHSHQRMQQNKYAAWQARMLWDMSCSDTNEASVYYWGYTPPMFYVYVLRSTKNEQLYVGYTEELEERLHAHNSGGVFSTQALKPWERIFSECYTNKADALRREQYLKTTAGKRALKIMLRETLSESN